MSTLSEHCANINEKTQKKDTGLDRESNSRCRPLIHLSRGAVIMYTLVFSGSPKRR